MEPTSQVSVSICLGFVRT
uniref:Uncharacterized protein n=1 Tax=Arundo donax TaxID=35708 RepID=A0A0A8Y6A7_ARUDO